MKKTLWLALILSLVCVFAFSACDSGDTPQTPNDTPSGTTDNTTESETDAHVHAFGEWTTVKDATCTVKGEQERSCSCGEKETKSIDATGHTEVIDASVAATCTTDGKTEGKHCSVCNETIIAQNTIPASHTDGKWITDTDATCTVDGSKHQVCSVCTATIKTEPIAATGHTDGEWITDTNATCTEDGSKHQVCSVCSSTIKTNVIVAKGHEFLHDKCLVCNEYISNIQPSADIQSPTIYLDTLTLSQSQGTVGDKIKISVKVTDDKSGVSSVDVYFESTITEKSKGVFLYYNDDTKLYEGYLEITDNMESGKWIMYYIQAYDNQRNSTYYRNKDVGSYKPADLSAGNIEIYGTSADIQSPTIYLNTLTLSQSQGTVGDKIKISVKVTDDKSGVSSVDVYFESTITEKSKGVFLYYNDDTKLYEGYLEITNNMESGKWIMYYIQAYDNQRNSTYYRNKDVGSYKPADLSAGNIEIYGTSADIQSPTIYLNTLTLSQSQGTAGDKIKISVKITDDKSGIASVHTYFESTLTGKNIGVYLYYNADTQLYEGYLEITNTMETGKWFMYYIQAYDKQNNKTYYGKNYNPKDLTAGDFDIY